ncbi:MAG: FHA domain-containing protein [Myxococcales bacterium]|nr:FHA domain-containing protein [Myxococcales bacterium]
MPRFLISGAAARGQIFELKDGDYVIGRDNDAQISLPNVSVSRHHAKISVKGQTVTLEDLGSGNGTTVNGNVVLQAKLNPKDELKVGKFSLVLLGDSRAEEFYKGRSVRYMPRYEPRLAEVTNDDTFVLSKDALRAMQNQSRLVEQARVVLVREPSRFWHPEDRTLSFGDSSAMVGINGWFLWGSAAEISWDGTGHAIRKTAWWVPLKVNDKATTRARLRHKDRFHVGDSVFRYEDDK